MKEAGSEFIQTGLFVLVGVNYSYTTLFTLFATEVKIS